MSKQHPQEHASRTLLWLGLGAFCFLVLAGWWALSQVRSFENALGRRLEQLAQAGSANVQVATAELQARVLRGEEALVSGSGRFLDPAEPLTLFALEPPAAEDEQGAWLLRLAEESELRRNDTAEALRLYQAAAAEGRGRVCRALAYTRLAALQRRLGEERHANAASTLFLELLQASERQSREAIVARSLLPRPDAELQADLLACIGGADETIALGLLRTCKLEDAAALAERRAQLARLQELRAVLPLAKAQAQGVAVLDQRLVAWLRRADACLQLGAAELPLLSAECALVLPNQSVPPANEWTRYALLGSLLPGYSIRASFTQDQVQRELRQYWLRLWLVLGLLTGVGGIALYATWRGLQREQLGMRQQSAFVARVGHDLRTPLGVIRMYAETLSAGRVGDRAQEQEFLRVIASEAERLGNLVQNVLDLSRLDHTRALGRRRVVLDRLVRELAEAHRPLFERAHMQFQVELPASAVHCLGDEDALRGALGNLLENCLHHAASGGSAEVVLSHDAAEIVLSVQDRGPGIDQSLGERAFERFVRGPKAQSRGAGLGLALVREVAEAHGGRVAALPRPGGGVILRIYLPLAQPPIS